MLLPRFASSSSRLCRGPTSFSRPAQYPALLLPTALRAFCYQTDVRGQWGTASWRMFFKNKDGAEISPWHDIPLVKNQAKKTFNYVVEMPLATSEKMEICKDETYNPIKQDVKDGKLRSLQYGRLLCNYGAFPQTWEDPSAIDPRTNFPGDNDPLDVIEVGSSQAVRGRVVEVKVLGALPLVDQNETDWKIVVLKVNDPWAAEVDDIADIEKVSPGLIEDIMEWYENYKTAEGKAKNKYAGKERSKEEAFQIIADAHDAWAKVFKAGVAL